MEAELYFYRWSDNKVEKTHQPLFQETWPFKIGKKLGGSRKVQEEIDRDKIIRCIKGLKVWILLPKGYCCDN